ncbi:DEAD/DEAH box helicase (plasmid) [Fibrella sp. ES10-3-2-2]
MTFRATFIGVDKHASSFISDLAGATRDATAMYSLFVDSMPALEAKLLTNEEATTANIRQALNETLVAADTDDVALFYFAGHGTESHQLVPHDTDVAAIDSSTIPMDELATRLADSKARIVIVILDCCFSGGATARVLADLPVPRGNLTTVADLQGKGRVIIAASKDDQPAYEWKGHGLFTHALLQTFTNSAEGISIGQLMDDSAQRVRAITTQYGWEQTPIYFNLIEGGLNFPPLVPGPTFLRAFPETNKVKVGATISQLDAFGLPLPLLEQWTNRFPNGLNELQLEAVNELRILDGKSAVIVAPTSSGKTFVGEMAAAKAITQGRKAVFLLPYRAIVGEKFDDFSDFYGTLLNQRVIRCTGDYTDDTTSFIKGKYDIALLTYEMFLNLSVGVPALLSKIGLIVLDEAQFITDTNRGITVELILTSLLTAREQGIDCQIVTLSAVIGSINYFNEWLDCQLLFTKKRPIPLIEGVLDRSGVFQYIDLTGQERAEQLLPAYRIVRRKDKPGSQDVIVPLVSDLVARQEQILIFRNQKGSTVGCSIYLANALGLPPANDALSKLVDSDPSSASSDLRKALVGGTAFHNSDLNRQERTVVEQTFRATNSPVRVLVATTTVAAGINTPASTVIIVENFFYGETRQSFTVAEYKNMAGRAGRLGLSEQGRSIMLAETPDERQRLFNRYVRGQPEPIRSSFEPEQTDTWILRLLSQVKEIPKDQIIRLLSRTYGGYLAGRQRLNWQDEIQTRLSVVLHQMEAYGFIEEELSMLRLSLLGKACGRSNLAFSTALKLVMLLKRISGGLTAETLMAHLQVLEEVGGYTPIAKKATKEGTWAVEVDRHYGRPVVQALQWGAKDAPDYNGRCKRAAILWVWINGHPIAQIESHYSVTPYAGNIGAGDVRGIADRTRLYLRAAYEIASIMLIPMPDEMAQDVDILLKQLETGLPKAALGLLSLPIRLNRGDYLRLYEANLLSTEAVLKASREALIQYLRPDQVDRLLELTSEEV